MPDRTTTQSSIIDNRGDNTLAVRVENITGGVRELWIATAFFSLDALALVAKNLEQCDQVRILFGDEADKTQRSKLLARTRETSDKDLGERRFDDPTLSALEKIDLLFRAGRVAARCYTAKKFHAKAYLSHREHYPYLMGILGSGNFTRPGLTRNLELNVELTPEQTEQLRQWYEERWEEAVADDVTSDLEREIKRQLDLYDPYAIYQRALIEWGSFRQGDIRAHTFLKVFEMLDPHQEQGYRRALQILERENGVMICDGVGLGKSFIALALMEYYCSRKKNVLLIAPKSIMESSWHDYLRTYLDDYRRPFAAIDERYMTWFGFDSENEDDAGVDPDDHATRKRWEAQNDKGAELKKLAERADVIVVDESHNFRTTNAQRYVNLFKLVDPLADLGKQHKKVILLTATPVNTSYRDLSAQLALATHDTGMVAGLNIQNVRSAAKELDRVAKNAGIQIDTPQLALDIDLADPTSRKVLDRILEAVLIQRKRATCVRLAEAAGKQLLFPHRETPRVEKYELGAEYKKVVELSRERFEPVAAFIEEFKKNYEQPEGEGGDELMREVEASLRAVLKDSKGLKFAAFLPEIYRRSGQGVRRKIQVEGFLASMIFTNTLKQLESSPPAFQGILQSLGTSLIARTKYAFGDRYDSELEPHLEWVRTPINQLVIEDLEGSLEEATLSDANGTETDEWLEQAIKSRKLHHTLAEFTNGEFDVDAWRTDLLEDLGFLKEIHAQTLLARQSPDLKLSLTESLLRARLDSGQKIVVFTQSQRTAFYLEHELRARLASHGFRVARIDSNVQQDARNEILHAFCPKYNPIPQRASFRNRVDVLICTDVLSEGVNMQETECILNYDIHWNPVRLIQRIGRVDRRLDPEKHPDGPHTISIINFFPPKEIDSIIKLVRTVEGRRHMIFNTLGLDQSFFKADDPAGTLREFNAQCDGEPSTLDLVNERYVRAIAQPDPAISKLVEQMPAGAFGVWDQAPQNGLFALFTMQPKMDSIGRELISEQDREQFKAVIGMPVLCMHAGGTTSLDAPHILEFLSNTKPGERSADPGDPDALKLMLVDLKNQANQSFRDVMLPANIQPKLVCWMELRS